MVILISPGNHGKKAQLQIQETILVIFIFIILIMFGLIFFYKAQSLSIANDFREFENERQTIDFITLGDLPEFSCTANGIKESCIDVTKIYSFMSLSSSKEHAAYYFTKFGYKNITIYQVYPEKNPERCSGNKISDCGVWEIYNRAPRTKGTKIIRDSPVSIYFPEKDEYAVGILVVEAYE